MKDHYSDLMKLYDESRHQISDIVNTAKQETNRWLDVLSIFNNRFSVPFIVLMENQDDVILRSEAPAIVFEFSDGSENPISVDEDLLLESLSQGEKRALYLLNVIFEIEARRSDQIDTWVVVDDIADSFDYKNKYAIIEYLKDMADDGPFKQIILTHNYDFFRTVASRLGVHRTQRFHAQKEDTCVKLVQEKYQKNPFSHWRNNFNNDEMLVAAIPFVRNIAEYCGYDDSFSRLTSVLHIKEDSATIKLSDIQEIFSDVMHESLDVHLIGPERLVVDVVFECCDNICGTYQDSADLERKIVVAIGCRLAAEKYMIGSLGDNYDPNAITSNQTQELTKLFKKFCPNNSQALAVIKRVNLMTPENIHVNAFMYEPIMDMSAHALCALYRDIKNLV